MLCRRLGVYESPLELVELLCLDAEGGVDGW